MHKPPVFHFLIQVVFNPVTAMKEHVVALQEQFRQRGFTDYAEETGTEVRVEAGPVLRAQQSTHTRWLFGRPDRSEGFVLVQNALIYYSNHYKGFNSHCKACLLEGIDLVHKAVGLDFVERIGMRYLDAVLPEEGAGLSDLVIDSLLGAYRLLPGELEHRFAEVRKSLKGGELVFRSLITPNGVTVPPDLADTRLALSPALAQFQGEALVMDMDYFVVRRQDFSIAAIAAQLDASHDILIEAFKTVLTEEARQTWLEQ